MIIYHFGSEVTEDDGDQFKCVLRSEYYIQKLDFLLRNPDYLCLELLSEVSNGEICDEKEEVQAIVLDIYRKEEPVLRRIFLILLQNNQAIYGEKKSDKVVIKEILKCV